MPYDYDPYRRNYRQGDTSRSRGSSRYGNDARRTSRNQGGQRNHSGSSSYGRNGSYQNRSRYGNPSRAQERSNRNGRQQERLDPNARRRSRNLTMPDTGYSLHSRRVRGSNGSLSHRLGMFDGRVIVLAAILILVVVVLITGISSCVRGANSSSTENTKQMSAADSRVAAGVSDSMVSEFSTQLDRNEKLAQIAANADQYDDDRLLQLALDEPAAISFVAGYPTAEKTTSGFNQSVSIGNPPLLYDWNTAWGYATYGDGCIAVTGSEPTTLSMAYMGLTGNTDQTPVGTAKALNSAVSTTSNSANTDSSNSSDGSSDSDSSDSSDSSNTNDSSSAASSTGNTTGTTSTGSSDADAFVAAAKNLGLTPTVLNVASSSNSTDSTSNSSSTTSSSNTTTTAAQALASSLQKGALVAVKLKSQTLTNSEHWALVVSYNSDGSVSVYDPTSSSVSSHTWGAGTVASSASEMISLVAAKTDQSTSTEATGTNAAGESSASSNGSSTNSTTTQSQGNSTNSSTSNGSTTGSATTGSGSSSSTGSGTSTNSTTATSGTSGTSSSTGRTGGSSSGTASQG